MAANTLAPPLGTLSPLILSVGLTYIIEPLSEDSEEIQTVACQHFMSLEAKGGKAEPPP